MPQLHQWIGNVFFRGADPAVINEMGYHELRYWNEWHEVMTKAEQSQIDGAKKKGRK